jgi:EAL domain-containing protein (putative c-di-GMP-specific phosphodiesterase class I)
MVVKSSDAAIVRGIIGIARDLSLTVVVEGIENDEQRDFLAREGARLGQGYLFSMPLLADDYIWLFRNGLHLPLMNESNDTKSTDLQ